MKRRIVQFHFPPELALSQFIDAAWPVFEASNRIVIASCTYYGAGKSKKEALTRPISLRTKDDLNNHCATWTKKFESDLVFGASYWTPDLNSFSITLERSRIVSRPMLFVSLEVLASAAQNEQCISLIEWCLKNIPDYRLAVYDIEENDTIIREYWKNRIIHKYSTGGFFDLVEDYGNQISALSLRS